MLKKTKAIIILTLTAILAAGAVTAAVQHADGFCQDTSTEKLLYCESDYDIVEATHL